LSIEVLLELVAFATGLAAWSDGSVGDRGARLKCCVGMVSIGRLNAGRLEAPICKEPRLG
jgi:hypothetical protein